MTYLGFRLPTSVLLLSSLSPTFLPFHFHFNSRYLLYTYIFPPFPFHTLVSQLLGSLYLLWLTHPSNPFTTIQLEFWIVYRLNLLHLEYHRYNSYSYNGIR
jgi:hypothetical protein